MQEKGKHLWQVLVVLLLNAVILAAAAGVFTPDSSQTLSKLGSRGDEVYEIQERLKQWGYYDGDVDGIFGLQTQKAVKKFQEKNGLAADGIAGTLTLQAMGLSAGSTGTQSSNSVELLARVISAEARGEPYTGQVAVGAVILNRVEHPSFPDTIAGVVYQPGAFTCMTDGQINQPVSESCRRAAQDAMNGVDPTGGAIYYYNPSKTSNEWMLSRPVIKQIGNHLFCT